MGTSSRSKNEQGLEAVYREKDRSTDSRQSAFIAQSVAATFVLATCAGSLNTTLRFFTYALTFFLTHGVS